MRRKRRREIEAAEAEFSETLRKEKRKRWGRKKAEVFSEQPEGTLQEQAEELERQIELSRREYEAVTSYLTDMQRIDRLEQKERNVVNAAANGIIQLSRERSRYQNSPDRIPTEQYRAMERYEKEIPNELKNLYEQEQYQSMVMADLRQLDGERAVIRYEREQAEDKKQFLRRMAIGSAVLVVILFLTLFVAGAAASADMTLPLLLTAVMAAAIVAYIASAAAACERVLKESVYRQNRVIQLTNKIKIKLVNSTSTLDYCYEKYCVGSYRELADLWERYKKAREEERRYRKSTEQLEQYTRQLVNILRAAGVKDAEIWIYQADALLDDKEMVEVRHHLNTRRQKIRERLEFNNEQLERCRRELAEEKGNWE